MYDPLLSAEDVVDDDNFLGLTDQAWESKTDPPLLVGLMGLPAAIIGIAWSFIRG